LVFSRLARPIIVLLPTLLILALDQHKLLQTIWPILDELVILVATLTSMKELEWEVHLIRQSEIAAIMEGSQYRIKELQGVQMVCGTLATGIDT
jgi:hypothetical protein